jgi:hypothetical protein
MAASSSTGTCRLCASTYTGKGISRHLSTCLLKHLENPLTHPDEQSQAVFHIRIQGLALPQYWLHLVSEVESKLENLDDFLRNIWLECCGHLSAFYHRGRSLDMDRQLCDVLSPGMEMTYCYDFGKATELSVKVISVHDAVANGWKPIHLLARNKAPEIPCSVCDKAPAVKVCTACAAEGSGWLCEACAEEHPCGEEIILPVLNSPRTGVCGYDGKLID